jgi:hypothetical protein
MFIRNQDKKGFTNVDRIKNISIKGGYKDKYGVLWLSTNGKGDEITLYVVELDDKVIGEYSTEEKAIKVLDMMQKEYLQSCNYYNAFDHSAQTQRPYIFIRNSVFQMPADSEV